MSTTQKDLPLSLDFHLVLTRFVTTNQPFTNILATTGKPVKLCPSPDGLHRLYFAQAGASVIATRGVVVVACPGSKVKALKGSTVVILGNAEVEEKSGSVCLSPTLNVNVPEGTGRLYADTKEAS